MNKKTLAALALAMGIVAAPNAFADNDMMRDVNKPGMPSMRGEKKGEMKEMKKEKGGMDNQGEHMGQVADQYLQSILGMTADQFKTELKSGKTVKDIITAKGLNVDTVMKQVRDKQEANMKAKLAADVASGKITQAQADEMVKQKKEMETKELTIMATALGTTVDKIKSDIAAGKSLDETLKSLGVSKETAMQKIRDAKRADMKAKLAADVASGKITQAQADSMLKKMIDNENARDAAIAKTLGINVSDLIALTSTGKTIEQIATEKGISMDTLKKTLDSVKADNEKPVKKNIVQKIKGVFQKKK